MVNNANIADNPAATPSLRAIARVLSSTLKEYFVFDAPLIALLIVFVMLAGPFVPTATKSAQDLVFSGRLDEPGMTMCLDSMTVAPYGNSANYWTHPEKRPALWRYWNYTFWVYCTGAYFDIPFLVYAPLKWMGVPVFPAAPLSLRLTSFAAAFAFLVLIYNFAKRHGGALAGIFTLLILLTSGDFMIKAASVAPDTLLLFLTVLALLIAQRHAAAGDWASLIALGLVAGWQHSTKFSGVYVAPVGLLAAYWGWQNASGSQTQRQYSQLFYRIAALGAASIAGLLMAIPYAAIDLAYWRSILAAPEPIKQATFWTYMVAIQAQQGWVLVILALAAIVALLWQLARGTHNRALVLALVVAASNILFWPIFYLEKTRTDTMVLGFALLAVIGSVFLLTTLGSSGRQRWRRVLSVTAVSVLCVWVASSRWYSMANVLSGSFSQRVAVDHATRAIEGIIPNDATILGDTAALILFDVLKYPEQSSSGTLRYWDLWVHEPQYFFLNEFMYGTEKYQQLNRTQHETAFSTYMYSVRLYQDLLVKWTRPHDVGPTNVPGIEVVARIPGFRKRVTTADELLFRGSWIERYFPNQVLQVNAIRARIRDGMTAWSPERYEDIVDGPGIIVYKLHPIGGPNGRISPVSGGDNGGEKTFFAFDESNGTRWSSSQSGDAVKRQAFLGFDYGGGATIPVRTVGIRWVDAAHTPKNIVIQHSDDGASWTDVMSVAPRIPASETESWDETFTLPDAGSHRLWRVLADSPLAAGVSMSIVEMRLPDPSW